MRSYARISLETIANNCRAVQQASGAEVMAVVKANAFGHGAVPVAQSLEQEGIARFAVASVAEAAELRQAGVGGEILLLYGLLPGEEADAAMLRLTPTLGDPGQLAAWAAQARKLGQALPCHIQMDTGMSRLGFHDHEAGEIAGRLRAHPELHLEGVSTHLASAELFGEGATAPGQHARFERAVEEFRAAGVPPPLIHVANSATVAYRTPWARPLARTGLALYGYVPDAPGAPESAIAIRPALSWHARVISVREVPSGSRVGYGGTFVAERDMRVAVVAVGYADGLDLRLSNRGALWFEAQRCPIVGLINMDLTLVDVTALAAAPVAGDEMTILGPEQDASALAEQMGSTPYEVLTGISARVQRIYPNGDL